ncbi:DMT family transporter [Dongia deserti]|uniref:DMT family transporter n=1 Tax=Dongia deserti TaxID=2268030 RepID=UPI0013C48662|nr:DMT family transporter [Dongia deserti]
MAQRLMVRQLWGWTILLTMGLSWGLSFSLARIAAVGGIHPLSLTFWEAAIAGAILLTLSGVRRRRIPVTRASMLLYLVSGLLGMVLPGAIFFYAAAHVPAGILAISLAIIPIVTFVASALLRLEMFALGRVTGVVLGALAIMLLVGPQQSLPDPAQLPWVLLALLAAACYAAFNVMLALWKPGGMTPGAVTAGMFVAAALMMSPILYATGTFVSFGWPWTKVEWAMLGLGVINAVSYSLFIRLIESAGPVFTSQTANLVTLFGVVWGMIIFGEQHSVWVWLSLVTMMLALSLVAPRQQAPVAA